MNNKKYLFLVCLPFLVLADTPKWLTDDHNENYQYVASSCVEVENNNILQAKMIASVIAKGNLSQNIGGQVTSQRNLTTQTIESKSGMSETNTLNEVIKVESKNFLTSLVTIHSGKYTINNKPKYCVQVGIK